MEFVKEQCSVERLKERELKIWQVHRMSQTFFCNIGGTANNLHIIGGL